MLESSRTVERTSTKIEGSNSSGEEENFPLEFGRAARAIWPTKTAFKLAEIAGSTDRAAKDWLSGKVPAPGIVIAAIVVAITKRKRR